MYYDFHCKETLLFLRNGNHTKLIRVIYHFHTCMKVIFSHTSLWYYPRNHLIENSRLCVEILFFFFFIIHLLYKAMNIAEPLVMLVEIWCSTWQYSVLHDFGWNIIKYFSYVVLVPIIFTQLMVLREFHGLSPDGMTA